MSYHPEIIKQKATAFYPTAKKIMQQLKKVKSSKLDKKVAEIHAGVFEKINCLECANCCRSLGPLLTDADIRRVSRSLKKTPGEFTSEYLRLDEDGDYVFRSMPCPFLGKDNYCSIYNDRPRACREYPHTDQKGFLGKSKLTLKNIRTCPAVHEILTLLGSTEF